MKNISAKGLRPEYNIIDIRDSYKYNNGHIYNAINISKMDLMTNHKKYLDKNKTYYIYCNFGHDSRKVCEYLINFGYDVINVYGGYNAFK